MVNSQSWRALNIEDSIKTLPKKITLEIATNAFSSLKPYKVAGTDGTFLALLQNGVGGKLHKF